MPIGSYAAACGEIGPASLAAVLDSVLIKSHQRFFMAGGSPGRRLLTVGYVCLGFLLFVLRNGRKVDGRQTLTFFAWHTRL
jgi:hypothetical protein